MEITFYKYQAVGNDFVLIDNRSLFFDKKNINLVAKLCDRKFGIGADGLILLENHDTLDFKMVYYNADGSESSMCGNGGRSIVHFANFLNIIDANCTFEAVDGLHQASILNGNISLQMINVTTISKDKDAFVVNTGSPHYVCFQDELDNLDVKTKGAEIRNNTTYKKEGINVNFVEPLVADTFQVRTFERGVEDETLSCGTGVTAVALCMHYANKTIHNTVYLKTLGGNLSVTFEKDNNGYKNIFLQGPAELVFSGKIKVND